MKQTSALLAAVIAAVLLLSLSATPASAKQAKQSPKPISASAVLPVGGHPAWQRGAIIKPTHTQASCSGLHDSMPRSSTANGEVICVRQLSSPAELTRLTKLEKKRESAKKSSDSSSNTGSTSSSRTDSSPKAASAAPQVTIPNQCKELFDTPQFTRTSVCLQEGGEVILYPSVDGVPDVTAPPLGMITYATTSYANISLNPGTGDYLYDGVGEDNGTAHSAEPSSTWTYTLELQVLEIDERSEGVLAGATVAVAPEYCQCDPPTLDWDQFTETVDPIPPLTTVTDTTDIQGSWQHTSTVTTLGQRAPETPDANLIWSAPAAVNGSTPPLELQSPPPMRCDGGMASDTDSQVPVSNPGCVYSQFIPPMKYALSGTWAQYPELALHIQDAQNGYGVPGITDGGVATPTELTRISSSSDSYSENRNKACPDSPVLIRPPNDTCDEYPFASTLQGANYGIGYSCRMINGSQNSGGGSRLGIFYEKQHILTSPDPSTQELGDQFSIQIVGGPYPGGRTWAPNDTRTCSYPTTTPSTPAPLTTLDLSAANRRAPIGGLYDWSKAGYRQGGNLPVSSDFTSDTACNVTAAEMTSTYNVIPDDGADDTGGIQRAIDDIKANCSPGAGYSKLSLIELPAGELDVSKQIYVDADYTVLRGAGGDPDTGTKVVFTPDADTRYDQLTDDGTNWSEDKMTSGAASGGWIWPGRGVFRVQSRAVNADYASDYAAAAANRKDLFEGTVNVHWKAGAKLRDKPGDPGYAARTGDTKIYIDNATTSKIRANLTVGTYVNIRAANTMNFYRQMKAVPTDYPGLVRSRGVRRVDRLGGVCRVSLVRFAA